MCQYLDQLKNVQPHSTANLRRCSGEKIKTAGSFYVPRKINLLIKYISASLTSMNHFTED